AERTQRRIARELRRLDAVDRQHVRRGVRADAEIIDVGEVLPPRRRADQQPAFEEPWQLDAGLAQPVVVDGDGCRRVDEGEVFAVPVAVAWTGVAPAGAGNHVAKVPVDAVCKVALTEITVRKKDRTRDRVGFGHDPLRLGGARWHSWRFLSE